MKRATQKRQAMSEKRPVTKEDSMKTNNIRKKCARSYGIFKVLTTGFLIIIFAFIAQPLMAKGKGWSGPARSPDKILQTLTDRLDLSSEQAEAVRPIIEDKSMLMRKIRDKNKLNRKETRSEMHRLMLDTDMRLGRILTDEQVDKYLELKQEQRKQMHRGKFGSKKTRGQFSKTPEQEMERLITILELTEEQTVQIEPIIRESMEKRQEVFHRFRDRGQQVRKAIRAEIQIIRDETHNQLSTILNAAQMEKLTSMKEERRSRMERRKDRPGHMGY